MNERVALNVAETKSFVEANNIVTLRADKTHDAPEVDELLSRLGGSAIPYYAIFPAGAPDQPLVFDGVLTKGKVLEMFGKALAAGGVPATASAAPSNARR